jgi:pimeloyl-ACP methyl ester carboxylesterase
MPSIRTNQGEIYFASSGRNSKSILFVHGAGADHTCWGYQFKFKAFGSVAALDLNGHGRSTYRKGDSLKLYIEDVLAVLDELGGKTFLVGHSLGGALALKIAFNRPLWGIGLISTGARLRVLPKILRLIEDDFEEAVDLILKMAFYLPHHLERARDIMLKTGPEVLKRDFLVCDSFDVMDKLGQIDVPTLIVCGKEDKLTPVKYSQYLKDHIPNSKLHIIEGAGHMVMLEQPEKLNKVIEGFLNKL